MANPSASGSARSKEIADLLALLNTAQIDAVYEYMLLEASLDAVPSPIQRLVRAAIAGKDFNTATNIIRNATSITVTYKDTLAAWKGIMSEYVDVHAPRDTGMLRDAMLQAVDDAKVVGSKIQYDMTRWAPEYGKYVEKMSGVNWTNPNTIEHPYREFTEYGDTLWSKLKDEKYPADQKYRWTASVQEG